MGDVSGKANRLPSLSWTVARESTEVPAKILGAQTMTAWRRSFYAWDKDLGTRRKMLFWKKSSYANHWRTPSAVPRSAHLPRYGHCFARRQFLHKLAEYASRSTPVAGGW